MIGDIILVVVAVVVLGTMLACNIVDAREERLLAREWRLRDLELWYDQHYGEVD